MTREALEAQVAELAAAVQLLVVAYEERIDGTRETRRVLERLRRIEAALRGEAPAGGRPA